MFVSDVAADVVSAALDFLIERGPLRIAFQPIVALDTGRIHGYEILGRCEAVQGILAPAVAGGPATLLALAHQHRRLLALDRRWRELAIHAIAKLGPTDLRWFINVDPRVTDQPDFESGFTANLVRTLGLDPARFVLELTEATAHRPTAIQHVLDRYARQGFGVAIDDLGAAQQSFATLLEVQPSIVKLDRLLVHGIEADRGRRHLLRALGDFGRHAGVLVIAEGIENSAQLAAVVDAGIVAGQGFLLGRPASEPRALRAEVRALCHVAREGRTPMRETEAVLLELVERLRGSSSGLEGMLQHVTDAASEVLDGARTSVRIVDEPRERLLVAARTGGTAAQDLEFRVGEGLAGWVVEHGTSLNIAEAEADPRFVPKPERAGRVGAFVGVPLLASASAIGVLAATSPSARFSARQVRALEIIAGIATPYLDIARLHRLAITDELTLALNRRALDVLIPREANGTTTLSVALFDIDHFKSINDRLGHAAGDEVLRAVPRMLRELIRRGDDIIRLGGDEFLLVLRGTSAAAATQIAERACRAVATAGIVGEPVTLSAGIAERGPDELRDVLLERVDRALYRAKADGRNQTVLDTGLIAR